MATLKLKKKPAPRAANRPPVRSAKQRPTLSQAQAERDRSQREAAAPRRDEGDRPRSARPPGDRPREGGLRDDRGPRPPSDRRPFGDRPRADRPAGDRPREGGFRDDRGPRPEGDRRPYGDRPRADRPAGDRPREGGFRDDRGPRPEGDRRPYGDRPRADRPAGDRPREGGFRDDRGPRPEGDRRPYGDRPRSEDRPRSSGARDERKPRPDAGPPTGIPKPRTQLPQRMPEGDGDRLSKRLGELGLASRREADDWIAAGWVRVNGKMAVLGQRISRNDKIDIDPAARDQQAKQITILLHKPIGYVSGQAEDGYEPAVVLVKPENRWEDDPSGVKFHPGHLRHLAPAGRLDIDSTGMLVLTQDGRVAKTLIGEDSLIEKEYLVRVSWEGEEPVPQASIDLLNHGLELDGVQLKPAKVSWQNEEQLRFVLREGRKRQIRRMCEAVGLTVLALKRVRIGRIPLAALPVGQWRYLGPFEKF